MKDQHFFFVSLGMLVLIVLVTHWQVAAPHSEISPPAPAESVAPQRIVDRNATKLNTPELMLALRHAELKRETVAAIDPADRKFFSANYGALRVMSEEAKALPAIDPADRKFFTSGYGTQYINGDKDRAVLPTTVNEPGNQIPIWFLLK